MCQLYVDCLKLLCCCRAQLDGICLTGVHKLLDMSHLRCGWDGLDMHSCDSDSALQWQYMCLGMLGMRTIHAVYMHNRTSSVWCHDCMTLRHAQHGGHGKVAVVHYLLWGRWFQVGYHHCWPVLSVMLRLNAFCMLYCLSLCTQTCCGPICFRAQQANPQPCVGEKAAAKLLACFILDASQIG
jgi:hypothetical protein